MNIWLKKTLLCGLVCVITLALQIVLHAEDPESCPAGKLLPTQLDGKVMSMEKADRVLTVDIKGTIIKINVLPEVKITKKGKSTKHDQLAAGQAVRIQFLEMPNGKLEVAALHIDPQTDPVKELAKGDTH